MKSSKKILIFIVFLITNYQLLITNDFSAEDNGEMISQNQFTIYNSQLTIDNIDKENSQLKTQNSELIAQVDTIENDKTELDTVQPKPLEDFVAEVPISKKSFEMEKSPTKAVLFSFLLPGLGQFYVESYWKVPVFLGATGTLTYLIIYNHNLFVEEQGRWESMDDSDPDKILSKSIKEYYRDQRDQDIFYLAGVYILAAVDAYVGAHLFDFNVSDDLTLKLHTGYINGARVGFSLKW